MRKLPRICHFHKKRFAECPEGCGHAWLIEDRIHTVLARRRKKSAARAAAKERAEKRNERLREYWRAREAKTAAVLAKRETLWKERPSLPCPWCKEPVPAKKDRKYCSVECWKAHRESEHPPPRRRELKVLYCAHCRQALPRVKGVKYLNQSIFCSAECRQRKQELRRKPPPPKVVLEDRECAECGKAFTPVSRMGRVCSTKCSHRYHAKLQDARHKEKRKLERCFFWPEKRSCPECGKEVLTTFENRDKKYCSGKCSKRRQGRMTDQRRLLRDPTFKVMRRLSSRIRETLRRKHVLKTTTSIKYLGCTAGHLRTHLESQFAEGMSWDNYGVFGWHVDHIIPCAAFDLSREDHQMVCFNYRNLRPLWHRDNNEKGDTVDLDVLLVADAWVIQEATRLGVSL